MSQTIHPETHIGAVHLTVSNLERAVQFYQQAIGFQIHKREQSQAYLGAGGPDLLILNELPGARTIQGTTGLYHFAILVPSRLHLAQSLQQLAATRTPLQGYSDHLVSEAIYLADPDGNGIEIYRDRPRHEWPYRNGQLEMASEPLDVDGLLAELTQQTASWKGLNVATTIGHIHLHVANLSQAQTFYTELLGFDLVMRYGPSAAFVSAGGYHHHIGLNTWAGVGVPPPPADAVGLRWFEIRLPDEKALAQVADRIREAGYSLEENEWGLLLRDPSQNGMILTHNV